MTDFLIDVRDWISEKTGYAAIPIPLSCSPKFEAITLDIPGYVQIDSYSCGAVAGFMALKTFHPKARFETFYEKVAPDYDNGTSTRQLVRALRDSGVGVEVCSRLSYRRLQRSIEEGYPVIASIMNDGADYGHWVTIYGVGLDSQGVFIANNSIPLVGRSFVDRKKFIRIWSPRGNGLICWGI